MEPEPILRDDPAVSLEPGGDSPDQAIGDVTNPGATIDPTPGRDVADAGPAEIQPAGAGGAPVPLPDEGASGASRTGPAATRVDLLKAWGDDPDVADAALQTVRVGANEVALVPFTSDTD